MAGSGLTVLYGGTFDPVHNGHLAIARAAAQALGCVVRLMPAADPPHRPAPGASAQQRAHMLELAVGNDPVLCVDRRELGRDGPSFTVQTLRELRVGNPHAPVALLVGADSFLGLPGWREWRALFGLAHFVIADRPGEACRPQTLSGALAAEVGERWTGDPAELASTPAGRVLALGQPLHDASATELRARIASGRPWRQLLPAAVADHIQAMDLYRDVADTASSL